MAQRSNPTPTPTWYDILGVGRDAGAQEIKAAWRAATDKFEPGSGSGQFRLFNEAADVLLDPERRAAYDAEIADAEPAPDVVAVETPARDAEPAPDVEAVETPAPAAPTRGPLAALGRLNDLVIALIAALAVVSLVLAGFLAVRIQHRVDDFDAGPAATAAAERGLQAVFSYDYRHMEADRDRAVRYLTPAYKKEYLKTFQDLIVEGPGGGPGPAVKTQAVVTADVVDTGIVDADRTRVRVIAFMNQTSVKGGAAPIPFQNRLVATLVHRGGSWLIDDVKTY